MPLHQRPSGHFDRRAAAGAAGPHHRRYASSSTTDEELPAPEERDRAMLDALKRANTELNKTVADRDRLQVLYEQATKKLAETTRVNADFKAQVQDLKEDNTTLREERLRLTETVSALEFEKHTLSKNNTELGARYENLMMRYDALREPSPTNPMVSTLPERPKAPRSSGSSKKESREDRGRTRDKEKREQKEQKAEKDRLSRRFDQKPEEKRPPPANHRNSFIEGWGPGGRSSSANPGNRSYQTVTTGRMQAPAVTPSNQAVYSSVPRTANPLSPGAYTPQNYGFDDGNFEDGNYHAHPLNR